MDIDIELEILDGMNGDSIIPLPHWRTLVVAADPGPEAKQGGEGPTTSGSSSSSTRMTPIMKIDHKIKGLREPIFPRSTGLLKAPNFSLFQILTFRRPVLMALPVIEPQNLRKVISEASYSGVDKPFYRFVN